MIVAHGADGEPADANCPESFPIAVSGGGSIDDSKGGALQVSAPITKGKLSANGQRPSGWRVSSALGVYTAYAVCSGSGKGEDESETEESEKEAAETVPKKAG